jgi:hypothetical protein
MAIIPDSEDERLILLDRQAFLAADTPERFLADIEALAYGEEE